MIGNHARNGDITVRWNSQGEVLLSPDGTQKLMPCDTCGAVRWVDLNVVAYECHDCMNHHLRGDIHHVCIICDRPYWTDESVPGSVCDTCCGLDEGA